MRKGAARGRRPPTADSLLRCVYSAARSTARPFAEGHAADRRLCPPVHDPLRGCACRAQVVLRRASEHCAARVVGAGGDLPAGVLGLHGTLATSTPRLHRPDGPHVTSLPFLHVSRVSARGRTLAQPGEQSTPAPTASRGLGATHEPGRRPTNLCRCSWLALSV